VSRVLSEDDALALVAKYGSAKSVTSTWTTSLRDDVTTLAKSHEALRAELQRFREHAAVAHTALGRLLEKKP